MDSIVLDKGELVLDIRAQDSASVKGAILPNCEWSKK